MSGTVFMLIFLYEVYEEPISKQHEILKPISLVVQISINILVGINCMSTCLN